MRLHSSKVSSSSSSESISHSSSNGVDTTSGSLSFASPRSDEVAPSSFAFLAFFASGSLSDFSGFASFCDELVCFRLEDCFDEL